MRLFTDTSSGLLPRRVALLSLTVPMGCVAAPVPQGGGVLVVSSSRAPAYQEAIEGLRSALGSAGVMTTIVALDVADGVERLAQQSARRPDVVVAVGSASVEAVAASVHGVAVVATMVLAAGASAAGNKIAVSITLELSPASILTRLMELYPERRRIAAVRGPALSAASAAEVKVQASHHRYDVVMVDCSGPRELLDKIGSLRHQVDFVWCFPDSALYSGPVVPALILAGIRNGLPLIGFSEGMVRAGALLGFYSDYRDIGLQTGESVLRLLGGQPLTRRECPRKVIAAINERVMRVLGAEYASGGGKGLVLVR